MASNILSVEESEEVYRPTMSSMRPTSRPAIGRGEQGLNRDWDNKVIDWDQNLPDAKVLPTGTIDVGWDDFDTGWVDDTGKAGKMSTEALNEAQGITPPVGAEQGLAKANVIGQAIGTGFDIGAQIATGVQTKRAREAEYERGLDEIFKAKREQEKAQKLAERQAMLQRQQTRSAMDFEMFKRDLQKGIQREQDNVNALATLKRHMDEDTAFRDKIRQLRNMGDK